MKKNTTLQCVNYLVITVLISSCGLLCASDEPVKDVQQGLTHSPKSVFQQRGGTNVPGLTLPPPITRERGSLADKDIGDGCVGTSRGSDNNDASKGAPFNFSKSGKFEWKSPGRESLTSCGSETLYDGASAASDSPLSSPAVSPSSADRGMLSKSSLGIDVFPLGATLPEQPSSSRDASAARIQRAGTPDGYNPEVAAARPYDRPRTSDGSRREEPPAAALYPRPATAHPLTAPSPLPLSAPRTPDRVAGAGGFGFTADLTALFSMCISYEMLKKTLNERRFLPHAQIILNHRSMCSEVLIDLVKALKDVYRLETDSWDAGEWHKKYASSFTCRIPAIQRIHNATSVFELATGLMQFQSQLMSLSFVPEEGVASVTGVVVKSTRLGLPYHFRKDLGFSLNAITHALAFIYQQNFGIPLKSNAGGISRNDDRLKCLWNDFCRDSYGGISLNPVQVDPSCDLRWKDHSVHDREGVTYATAGMPLIIHTNAPKAAWAFQDEGRGLSGDYKLIREEFAISLGRRWCAFKMRYQRMREEHGERAYINMETHPDRWVPNGGVF